MEQVESPLKELYWLPIKYRIQFKVLLLVNKSLNDKGPKYLKELIIWYIASHSLCSASSNCLVEPRTNLKTCGERAFSVAAPRLWNMWPGSIKDSNSVDTFKWSLKTYFFKKAFIMWLDSYLLYLTLGSVIFVCLLLCNLFCSFK